jgi:hypothetical protein
MFPQVSEEASRVMIGASNEKCTQPYSASLLNISAMSYGALRWVNRLFMGLIGCLTTPERALRGERASV